MNITLYGDVHFLIWYVGAAGGDVWVDGEEGEGGVHPRADAPLSRQEGLRTHADHQQESDDQVL